MSNMVKVELENGETAEVSADYAEAKGLTALEPDAPVKAKVTPEQLADRSMVRARLASGAEVSVAASFAAIHGLTVLKDKRAANGFGEALRDKPSVDLRGKELDQALSDAGLPTGGTAAEKRQRYADHLAGPQAGGNVPSGDNTEGVSS